LGAPGGGFFGSFPKTPPPNKKKFLSLEAYEEEVSSPWFALS